MTLGINLKLSTVSVSQMLLNKPPNDNRIFINNLKCTVPRVSKPVDDCKELKMSFYMQH